MCAQVITCPYLQNNQGDVEFALFLGGRVECGEGGPEMGISRTTATWCENCVLVIGRVAQ